MIESIQLNVNNPALGGNIAGRASYQPYSRQIAGAAYNSDVDASDDLDSESEIPGKHLKNGQYISEEDEFEFPRVIPIRASTAPPRPLTEIEEFRRGPEFMLLENTVMTSDHLK
jgi:hypothetical protein